MNFGSNTIVAQLQEKALPPRYPLIIKKKKTFEPLANAQLKLWGSYGEAGEGKWGGQGEEEGEGERDDDAVAVASVVAARDCY